MATPEQPATQGSHAPLPVKAVSNGAATPQRDRRSAVSLVLRPRDAEVLQAVEVLGSMLPGQARRLFGRWVPEVRGQRPWQLLSIALAILAGCSLLYLLWEPNRQTPVAVAHLGLDVKQAPSGMEVIWDRRAPAVQTADSGVLSITDGRAEQTIQLNATAVARGKFSYKASGNNLRIRLSLYGDGNRVATESFGVMAVAQPAPKAQEAPPPPPPAAPEPPVEQAQAPKAVPKKVAAEPVKVRKPAPRPKTTAASTRAAVQAVAVHEVRPGVPDGIRNRIRRPIVVPVRVQISASGKVTSVTPHKSGNSLFRYLAERAAIAARSWRFRPARAKDGTPVPTEKTLYFVFKS